MKPPVFLLLLTGCVLDWTGAVDDDAAEEDAVDDADQVETAEGIADVGPDDSDDQVDDPGSDVTDEDDGWSDPAGEDGAEEASAICTDDCFSHDNGVCDDGGPGSSTMRCDTGTDCTDCGPRY